MTHVFLLYSSSNDSLEKLDAHINKSNSSNALGNVYDIIPANLVCDFEFLTSSSKFKDCKDFVKKNKDLTNFKEILYDGNINDLNTIYTNEDEAYWVLRVPVNRLITSFLPSKVKSGAKKENFLVFVKNDEDKVLIGVADSKVQVYKLIEETCDFTIAKKDFSEDNFEIVCDKNTFIVQKK